MNLEEIKAWLDEHKDDVEVKAFYAELSPEQEITAEAVAEYLKTDDGKMIVQPMVDQAVTKAVKTRDKAHEVVLETEVKKRLATELLKVNPEKSPLEIKVQELEENARKLEADRARDNLKRQLVEEAAKMNINPFFIDDYTPESIEVGKLFLQKIKSYNDELVKKTTNDLMADGGFKPRAGKDHNKDSKIDLSALSQDEAIRLEMEGKLDEQLNM